ncbi:MAG: hypothetical protein DBY32_03920 [Phascolarctobacterium sp.]|nr:MAG: hypothetical protein DBY32_03920 [Phascolarctobacterium sp.]
MKKYCIVAGIALIMLAVMALYPPPAEPSEKIYVPVTVHAGDTLGIICRELAATYGDERDWREIVYFVQKQNKLNTREPIRPGDKLIVELLVERGKQLEKEKCR